MKISDAIAMGRTLVEPNDGSYWLYQGKGCACGMAMAAMGETVGLAENFLKHWPISCIERGLSMGSISIEYNRVVRGEQTLDQLIDWVRAHEPSDTPVDAPSPAQDEPSINEKEHKYVESEVRA